MRPVSATGGRECTHSQRGYQLIRHIMRATGSDVGGSRRILSALVFTDRMDSRVSPLKIKLSPIPPIPKLQNPFFILLGPTALNSPQFHPPSQLRDPSARRNVVCSLLGAKSVLFHPPSQLRDPSARRNVVLGAKSVLTRQHLQV